MTTHNIPISKPVFSARLTPHRSLSRQGFLVLIGFVSVACLAVSILFLALGVWPIVGFMGLDVLLVYFAFRANYRTGRAYEDVEVSRQHILLRKVTEAGDFTDHHFPQFGTRLEVDRHDEIGIVQMCIANRQDRVTFGAFLNPTDKETFAAAFSRALSRAKR